MISEEEYIAYLNSEPDVVRENPDGSKYCPISYIQEKLMFLYSGNTKFELLRETIGAKGSFGVGRLHYKVPYSGEWLYQDGSASIPHERGMRLDFPALGSHIMLSCAKKIGRRFGMYLNRTTEDEPVVSKEPIMNKVRIKPDTSIMRKFMDAVANKDESTIRILSEIYEIRVEENSGIPIVDNNIFDDNDIKVIDKLVADQLKSDVEGVSDYDGKIAPLSEVVKEYKENIKTTKKRAKKK